jgi:hypothetical protein
VPVGDIYDRRKAYLLQSAYADRWYKNLRRQSSLQFRVLQAIITEIEDKDGADIVKSDLYFRNPEVANYIFPTRPQCSLMEQILHVVFHYHCF